jgi:hypothetical protein
MKYLQLQEIWNIIEVYFKLCFSKCFFCRDGAEENELSGIKLKNELMGKSMLFDIFLFMLTYAIKTTMLTYHTTVYINCKLIISKMFLNILKRFFYYFKNVF